MKSFEVFTDKYSVIIQCSNIDDVIAKFKALYYSSTDEIKQIVEVNYRDECIKNKNIIL